MPSEGLFKVEMELRENGNEYWWVVGPGLAHMDDGALCFANKIEAEGWAKKLNAARREGARDAINMLERRVLLDVGETLEGEQQKAADALKAALSSTPTAALDAVRAKAKAEGAKAALGLVNIVGECECPECHLPYGHDPDPNEPAGCECCDEVRGAIHAVRVALDDRDYEAEAAAIERAGGGG